MCEKIVYDRIKAKQIKPGMVINTHPDGNDTYGYCLVTACSGIKEIEYTHFDYQDCYGGQLVGSLDSKHEVEVITDDLRNVVINKIKNDTFKWFNDAERNIDLIRLIEAMS